MTKTEFQREERYVVFKVSDLGNSLKGDEIRRLAREYAEQRRLKGKEPLECVVVEKDWPEYEPTWKAIEARMTGAQPAPSIPEGWLRAIDEALIVAHIGVASAEDSYEVAKRKLYALIGFHVDVATDPAVNGGCKLMPIEPTKEILKELEAAEKERDAYRKIADSLALALNTSNHKRYALRARIEAMERQEPVGVLHVGSWYGEELQDWEFEANQCACDKLNEVYVSNPTSLPLYALPGAKGD